MHDCLRPMLGKQHVQRSAVGKVALDEGSVGMDGGAVALVEVVEDDDLFAAGNQLFDDDTADVAGAAGDKDFHGWGVFLPRITRILLIAGGRRLRTDRPEQCIHS